MPKPVKVREWVGIWFSLTFMLWGVAVTPLVNGDPVDTRLIATAPLIAGVGVGVWWAWFYLSKWERPPRPRPPTSDTSADD